MWYKKLLFLMSGLLLICMVGCVPPDVTGIKIDLSQLNWQIGVLIVLAYFANSQGHFASLASAGRKLLQSLKILPGEASNEALTAEELAKILADLFGKLQGQPKLQAKVMDLMAATSIVAEKEAVANAPEK